MSLERQPAPVGATGSQSHARRSVTPYILTAGSRTLETRGTRPGPGTRRALTGSVAGDARARHRRMVSRKPLMPDALAGGPFTLSDARNLGLEYWHLRSRIWRRLGPSTYALARRPDGPLLRLEAASRRLPAAGSFSGLAAAWLHGLDVEPCNPIDVTVPKGEGVSGRAGHAGFASQARRRRRGLRTGDAHHFDLANPGRPRPANVTGRSDGDHRHGPACGHR